jgi:hypothetical protein
MSNSQQKPEKVKRPRGRPFLPGQAPKSPGRPPVPPEVRAVQRRVVADLVGELKAAADLAVDALVEIVQNPRVKESDRIAAASQILDRSFGRAVQAIDAKVLIEEGATRITAEDIRRAALAVASSRAEDAVFT